MLIVPPEFTYSFLVFYLVLLRILLVFKQAVFIYIIKLFFVTLILTILTKPMYKTQSQKYISQSASMSQC